MAQEAGERPKHERIECVCDFSCDTSKFGDYAGLWVQCSECMAWLHGNCIGMKRAPMGKSATLFSPSGICFAGFVRVSKRGAHWWPTSSIGTFKTWVATRFLLTSCRRVHLLQVREGTCECNGDCGLWGHTDCLSCLHPTAVAVRDCQAHTRRWSLHLLYKLSILMHVPVLMWALVM